MCAAEGPDSESSMKRICRVQGIAVCWSPVAVYYIPLNPAAPGVDKFVAGMMANKRAQKITFDLKSQMVALLSGTLLCTSTVLYANLYCTVLYRTVLYCAVAYCTLVYCAALCCGVVCFAVLYCGVLCCAVLQCTVLSCTVMYCTVLYCTVLYCTALHCTALSSKKSYNAEHSGIPADLLHILVGSAGLPERSMLSCPDCTYSGICVSAASAVLIVAVTQFCVNQLFWLQCDSN